MNQLEVYIYIPSFLSLPASPLGHQSTELHSAFPLATYFTCGSVYMSMPLSQFVLPSPSLLGSQAHSLGLCLYSYL